MTNDPDQPRFSPVTMAFEVPTGEIELQVLTVLVKSLNMLDTDAAERCVLYLQHRYGKETP